MMFGFHTGDLNPIWTVPMLGTHKSRHSNPYQPPCLNFRSFNINPVIDARPR